MIANKYKYFFCLVIVIAFAVPTKAESKKPSLAILDFEAASQDDQDYSRVLSKFVRTYMVNYKLFAVVERKKINQILNEQSLQQSGIISNSYAIKIGQLLAAQKIMVGNVSLNKLQIYVTAKIIDVESGKIEYSENVVSPTNESLELIAEKLSRKFAARIRNVSEESLISYKKKTKTAMILRSALLPGLGHLHNDQTITGLSHMFFFLSAGGWYMYNSNSYLKLKKQRPAFSSASPAEEEFRKNKNSAGIILLVHYAIQLAHAYISGTHGKAISSATFGHIQKGASLSLSSNDRIVFRRGSNSLNIQYTFRF